MIFLLKSTTKAQVSQKEEQTTRTLFVVCLCFVIFVMPMETYDILFYLDLHGGNSYIALTLHFLYWFQYSANFFIYAARSDQFRKAYLFFFSSVILTYYVLSINEKHCSTRVWFFIKNVNFFIISYRFGNA